MNQDAINNNDDDGGGGAATTETKANAASSSSSPSALLLAALVSQARELRSLSGSRVLRIPCGEGGGPDAELFFRAAVAQRRPALLEGAAGSSSTFSPPAPWTEEQFLELAGGEDTVVTVAETPHGRADAVVPFNDDDDGDDADGEGNRKRRVFAQPRDARMPLGELLRSLHAEAAEAADSPSPPPRVVRYAQRQNDSASDESEFAALLDCGAVPRRLPWAEQAFASAETEAAQQLSSSPSPDAVNVWVGGPRSATSWHRDHYENVHFCLLGEKEFHLLPPGEGWRLQRRKWRAARYEEAESDGEEGGKKKLVPVLEAAPERSVRWSAAPPPPCSPSHAGRSDDGGESAVDLPQEAFPWLLGSEAARARLPPHLTVVVKAGDAIYLPPLWWHCVTQRGGWEGGGEGEASASASPPAARSPAPLPSSVPSLPPPPVTVCVNYWYDMRFDDRYCASRLADRLERALLPRRGEDEEEGEESSSSSSDDGEDDDDEE